MKNIITIIIMLVAAGCGKSNVEKVVGTYKLSLPISERLYLMFRKDGVCEKYWLDVDGKETRKRGISNWEIKNDELFVTNQEVSVYGLAEDGLISGKYTMVLRIEKDGSLTEIAYGTTKDEKFERRDRATKDYTIFKKVK